ncbi:MAG TPA: DUF996 domain-containing protein [Candidatus Deferrimicrobiaceae bacterium]|nr:DUF996 domain-containing protein [Candidatus Deferrimicrobiaceae bacterium]
MLTLDLSRNLGGIGAILLVISVVVFFTQPLLIVIALVGAVLLLVALHGLAQFYREKRIFNSGLLAFIAFVVGAVVTFASVVYLVLYTSYLSDFISLMYPGFNGDWSNLPNLTPNADVNFAELLGFVGPIFGIFTAAWISAIFASFFAWRAFKNLAAKSGVNLFSTAGIILLVGALLTIVFGLGLILMWIGVLLLAIAFFQMKTPSDLPSEPQVFSPQSSV